MDKTIHSMKAAVAAAIGLLTGLWGWLGWLAVGWVACMVLDYLTGSLAAARAGAWSSGKARDGIWHKCGMLVVVLVWYIVTELGSMVENAAAMGAPVPKWLAKLLALGQDAVDGAGDKLGGEGKE